MPSTTAEFIEDVDQYMQGQRLEVKLAELEAQLRSFKQHEQALMARRARTQERLPEIKLALEAVLGLIAKQDSEQPLVLDFELTESIYAQASLQHVECVNLWLGANVMVEYPLAEAKQLLQEQLQGCEASLEALAKELQSVKASVAISEVSMARVFNWDVEQRRKAKAQQGGGSSSSGGGAAGAAATAVGVSS